MPYTAKNLPARVKKFGAKKKRQWMHVWNSTYKKTGDEGKAFAAANGVVKGKKELDDMSVVKLLAAGDKSVKVTLFSGADDPDLPEHVRALPVGIRSRWVNTYNWGVMDTQDDEDAQEQADSYTTVSVDDLSEILGKKETAPVPAPVGAPVASTPVTLTPTSRPSLLDRIMGRKATPTGPGMFQVYKGSDGVTRALLVYSNIFKDKDREIFSTLAHKEYADAVDAGEAELPAFHLWHAGPETEWGTCETVSFVDSFAIAGGRVHPGKEGVALKLKEMADKGELAVSFGYIGLRGPDGVHAMYRPFEISPLPVGSESNPWTSIDFKENGMAFTDKKKGWLKDNFGYKDEDIVRAEKAFEGMGAALRAVLGPEGYKEAAGETPTPPPQPTPPDPPPTPPPPSPAAAAVSAEASIMPQIESMATAIKEIAGVVGTLVTEVKSMKEAAPAATAAAADANVMSRIAQGPGFSPARSPDNVVAGAKEQADDWLGDIFRGAFPNMSSDLLGVGGGAALAAVAPANGTAPAAPPAGGEVK